jgi:hypothetical protein
LNTKNVGTIAAILIILSGCATIPDVPGSKSTKIGEDSYIIQIEAVAMGVAGRKRWLFEQANAHCDYLGKKVGETKSNQIKGGLIGDYVLDIEYKCISK